MKRTANNVSKDQIQLAKQMDLLTYLQGYETEELVQLSTGEYTTRTHGSLKISNGRWYWWSRGIGGRSALDYLIKVRGIGFVDAVRHLCKCTGNRNVPYTSALIPKKRNKPKALELPPRKSTCDRIIAYLIKRGIDAEIIEYCIQKGKLYEDMRSNCVFVGFDDSDKPRYASIRSSSQSSTFIGDAKGSDKHYSFSILAEQPTNTLLVFESAIDLLSYLTLIKEGGDVSWRNVGDCLSLSGVFQPSKESTSLPKALERYLQNHTDVTNILLYLDNDEAGREAASGIVKALPPEFAVKCKPPDAGKDYNERLMLQKGISNNIKTRGANSTSFCIKEEER